MHASTRQLYLYSILWVCLSWGHSIIVTFMRIFHLDSSNTSARCEQLVSDMIDKTYIPESSLIFWRKRGIWIALQIKYSKYVVAHL